MTLVTKSIELNNQIISKVSIKKLNTNLAKPSKAEFKAKHFGANQANAAI